VIPLARGGYHGLGLSDCGRLVPGLVSAPLFGSSALPRSKRSPDGASEISWLRSAEHEHAAGTAAATEELRGSLWRLPLNAGTLGRCGERSTRWSLTFSWIEDRDRGRAGCMQDHGVVSAHGFVGLLA
jgi:hypothetical protein